MSSLKSDVSLIVKAIGGARIQVQLIVLHGFDLF